jgi:hypothetical protein
MILGANLLEKTTACFWKKTVVGFLVYAQGYIDHKGESTGEYSNIKQR